MSPNIFYSPIEYFWRVFEKAKSCIAPIAKQSSDPTIAVIMVYHKGLQVYQRSGFMAESYNRKISKPLTANALRDIHRLGNVLRRGFRKHKVCLHKSIRLSHLICATLLARQGVGASSFSHQAKKGQ